jgi:hypothetical protein
MPFAFITRKSFIFFGKTIRAYEISKSLDLSIYVTKALSTCNIVHAKDGKIKYAGTFQVGRLLSLACS